MRTNKKPKTSKFGLGGWVKVKGEYESIEKKDVFEFIFPEGWRNNPLYKKDGQDCWGDSNDDDDEDMTDNDTFSSVTGTPSVAKKKVSQPFFVVCAECDISRLKRKISIRFVEG